MKKTEKLFILADELNIDIHFNDLSSMGFLGLYIESDGLNPCILIDNSIKHNEKELSSILLEELGHYYTSTGDSISNTSSYRKRLDINKCELKAEKWLCEYQVPEEDLVNAINSNPTSIEDICDYLDIDKATFIKRLEFLSKRKQSLDLGNNRFLILTNLPNISIYDNLN